MDCASTDAARVFVVSLYLSLCKTLDAFVSIVLPVCLSEFAWDKAEAANCFWIAEDEGSRNTSDANEPTFFDVCLPFFYLSISMKPQIIS